MAALQGWRASASRTHIERAAELFAEALAYYVTAHEGRKLTRIIPNEKRDVRGQSALWRLAAADSRLKPFIDAGIALGKAALDEFDENGDGGIKPLFVRLEILILSHYETGDFNFSEKETAELEELMSLSLSVSSGQYALGACALQIAIISLWKLSGRDPSEFEEYENFAFSEVRRSVDTEAAGAYGLTVLTDALWLFLKSEELADFEVGNYRDAAIVYLGFLNWRDKALIYEYGSKLDFKEATLGVRKASDARFYGIVNKLLKLPDADSPDYLQALYLALSKRRNIAYSIEMASLSEAAIDPILATTTSRFGLEALQQALPENAALLEFFDLPAESYDEGNSDIESYLTFLVTETGIKALRLEPHRAIGQSEERGFSVREQGLSTSIERVLSICENKACNRLFICSEGLMNGISFASLPYRNGYVIDRFAVCNIANTSDLLNPKNTSQLEERALVLSHPAFGKGDDAGFEELTGSDYEGTAICESVVEAFGENSVTLLRSHGATKAALVNSLKTAPYGIIHLSTHGEITEAGVPCLVLAGVNDGGDAKLFQLT